MSHRGKYSRKKNISKISISARIGSLGFYLDSDLSENIFDFNPFNDQGGGGGVGV